jgi:hypothetical protein
MLNWLSEELGDFSGMEVTSFDFFSKRPLEYGYRLRRLRRDLVLRLANHGTARHIVQAKTGKASRACHVTGQQLHAVGASPTPSSDHLIRECPFLLALRPRAIP